MGKEALSFFIKDCESGKYLCKVDSCEKAVVTGSNSTYNLERHLRRFHGGDGKAVKLHLTEQQIIDACVELVTTNGRPFAMINDTGFRKILDPVLSALKIAKKINAENVQKYVHHSATQLQEKIAADLKLQMVSLKIDVATRHERSVLGINVQFIKAGKICIRTLAMKELAESHTGEYLKTVTLQVLSSYGIDVKQVYSVTTDNGANMLKAVKLMNVGINDLEADPDEEDDGVQVEAAEDSDALIDWDAEINVTADEANDEPELLDVGNVKSVRCAAHTLQLAVYTLFKSRAITSNISKCRQLTKKLRTPTIMLLIKAMKLKHPIIDVPTRWKSTFDMIDRLLSFKDFCAETCNTYTCLDVPPRVWEFGANLVEVLAPVKEATLRLQAANLLVGDFYAIWLKTKLQINALPGALAKGLSAALKKREDVLFTQETIIAGIYLDPRFKATLSSDAVAVARRHLIATWNIMQQLLPTNTDEGVMVPPEQSTTSPV